MWQITFNVMQKIVQETLVDLLLSSLPELNSIWTKFTKEWEDEPDTKSEGFPIYLFLNQIASYVIMNHNQIDWCRFSDSIEYALTEGDDYVIDACSVGLLEDMQNKCLRQSVSFDEIEKHLRPKSKTMWNQVNEFWQNGTLIKNDALKRKFNDNYEP